MKKRQVILYVFVMLILITTSVYATIDAKLGFKLDKKTIHPGDEISVTLRLEDVNTDKGIKAVEGFLNVKSNIIDSLTVDNIVTNEDGKVEIDDNNILNVYDAGDISSNSETGIIFNNNPRSEKGDYKIIINFSKPITKDIDLVTIKFKIKDNVKVENYEDAIVCDLFEIFANDASEKNGLDKVEIPIKIEEKVSDKVDEPDTNLDDENDSNNENENGSGNNSGSVNNKDEDNGNTPNKEPQKENNNNVIKQEESNPQSQKPTDSSNKNGVKAPVSFNNVGSQKGDNTTSPSNLPKTGAVLLIAPIVILVIVGIICYTKYSKYNYHE